MKVSQRRWLLWGAVVAFVFLGAVSMHMERIAGWAFLLLCFMAGSLGGLAFIFGKQRWFDPFWDRASKWRKLATVAGVAAFVLVVSFASNYGKPDAASNDSLAVFGVCVGLILLGCYYLFCRFLDFFGGTVLEAIDGPESGYIRSAQPVRSFPACRVSKAG